MENKPLAGWIVAGVIGVVALMGWLRHPAPPKIASAPSPEVSDNETDLALLRARIASLQSENQMLYGQLGDANAARKLKGGQMAALPRPAASAVPVGKDVQDAADTISDLAARVLSGDQASGPQVAAALGKLMTSGRAGVEAAHKAYDKTNDPKAKTALLPFLLMGLGSDRPDFVATELPNSKDPLIRDTLIQQAALMPDVARQPQVEGSFLGALQDQNDPAARANAASGLRYATDPAAQQALLNAAQTDPDESVRINAIGALSSRPGMRDQLQSMVANDPSSRVKQVGNCELLLANQSQPQPQPH